MCPCFLHLPSLLLVRTSRRVSSKVNSIFISFSSCSFLPFSPISWRVCLPVSGFLFTSFMSQESSVSHRTLWPLFHTYPFDLPLPTFLLTCVNQRRDLCPGPQSKLRTLDTLQTPYRVSPDTRTQRTCRHSSYPPARSPTPLPSPHPSGNLRLHSTIGTLIAFRQKTLLYTVLTVFNL